MTNGKIITYFALLLAMIAVLSQSEAAVAVESAEARALVGEVPVNLLEPGGLVRVDGLCPEADKFMLLLSESFKLRILAVFADPEEWRGFVSAVVNKEPRALPRMAVISVPVKMDGKSFDKKTAAKERLRLNKLVNFAITTGRLADKLNDKANAKLREKLGVDLRFNYLGIGEHAGKFDESERSVSYSVLTSLDINGRQTDSFVTASSLSVGDKLVFLAWVEPHRDPGLISEAKTRTLDWVKKMGEGNPDGA